MGKTSQRKGRTAELEVVKIFQAHGIDAKPGDPASYGSTPDVTNIPFIHPEIKRCEQVRLTAWMQQAVHDAEKFNDGAPTVFHRRNRQEWLCTMRLSDWMQIYTRAVNCKCSGGCCQRRE